MMKQSNVARLLEAARSPRARAMVSVLILMGLSGVAFQNCSAKMTFQAEKPSLEQFYSTSAVTINNGAQFTNDANVTVQIKVSSSIEEMYLTNDPTCETGGTWQSIKTESTWSLGQKNEKADVFVRFKPRSGVYLPCISASIVHDDIPPGVAIEKAPGMYSKNLVEDVEFSGQDTGSGLDKFECRFTGQTDYKSCSALEKLSILVDASALVNLQVRALDRAGNRSALLERNWLIDRTPPKIIVLEKPDATMARNSASVRYEAMDESNGSGVDRIYCQLDNGSAKLGCELTEVMQNLIEGPHLFQIWASDKAGNESQKTAVMWTVTTPPPGSFQILGLSSTPGVGAVNADTEINGILGISLVPRVTWSTSIGAVSYELSILNATATTQVCGPIMTTETAYGFSATQCTLTDGGRYVAKIIPYAGQNNVAGTPQMLPFYVDVSAPLIAIQPAVLSVDQKNATLQFTITDLGSGVRDATCKKTYKTTEQIFDCKTLTTYTFTNLAEGDHTFTITASDGAQNERTSSPVTWKSKLVVCDPFSITLDGTCKKGLKGNIYYLTGDQLKAPFKTVNDYILKGKLANAILYLSQVFVPTRSFSAGFIGDESVALVDDSGAKLIEYFALDLETIIKLTTGDANGRYQFAVLSDDGAILETKDSSGRWNPYLDNDGDHSTKLACDKVGTVFDSTSRVPMRIKYYQGPRTEIALTLMWRYRANNESLEDPACGTSGNSEFFGPNYNDKTNAYKFGQLIDRKWKVLTSDNFILAEGAK